VAELRGLTVAQVLGLDDKRPAPVAEEAPAASEAADQPAEDPAPEETPA
jgi:hypothetical protein